MAVVWYCRRVFMNFLICDIKENNELGGSMRGVHVVVPYFLEFGIQIVLFNASMPFASSPKQPNLHTIITVSQCKKPLQTASTAVCVVDEILASVALVLLEVMLQRRPATFRQVL